MESQPSTSPQAQAQAQETERTQLKMPEKVRRRAPFLIGVAGGTASGKSTVCEKIMENLRAMDQENMERHVVHISQDSFYRELRQAEKVRAAKGLFNFDHPGEYLTEELFLNCHLSHY